MSLNTETPVKNLMKDALATEWREGLEHASTLLDQMDRETRAAVEMAILYSCPHMRFLCDGQRPPQPELTLFEMVEGLKRQLL